jgi:tetratricopeptide (TPR) repeat protein
LAHAFCLDDEVRFLRSLFRHSLGVEYYVFAIVFALRVIVLARLTSSPFLLPTGGDMHFYDQWAQRILQGHLTDHLAFYGLPLYAYLLALIYKLAGYGPFVPGLLQAGFDAGTAVILYKLGTRVFSGSLETTELKENGVLLPFLLRRHGELIGAITALGWAFFAPAQAYAVVLMPTVWLVFTFWLLVWLVVRSDLAPTRLASFGYGLVVGFAAMGVATILFLVPLLLGAILLKPSRRAGGHELAVKLIASLLLFSGIGIGTSPCWVHNYFIARDPVLLSAHGGVNLWIGNNPLANGYPKFPPGLHAGQEAMLNDSISVVENTAGHPLKRAQISAYWAAKAEDYIRNQFGDWLKLLGTKISNFWSAFQYDDLSIITAFREHGVILPTLRFGLVAALAIPGLLIAYFAFPLSRWIMAAIALHMMSLLGVFVTERYRLAAVPGLLLFAASGVIYLWQAYVTADYRRATGYVLLLTLATWFVSLPKRDPSLWALDNYNSGWRALESDDLVTAEEKLNLAYAYVPGNAETNFALGNLHFAKNEKESARFYYLATLRLDPNHEGACNNLGVLALEEKRWSRAANFFAKAVQQDPRDAKTHYLLARAQLKRGNTDAARAEIETALQLKPHEPEFLAAQAEISKASGDGQ